MNTEINREAPIKYFSPFPVFINELPMVAIMPPPATGIQDFSKRMRRASVVESVISATKPNPVRMSCPFHNPRPSKTAEGNTTRVAKNREGSKWKVRTG